MAEIEVDALADGTYRVTVVEGESATSHEVTVSAAEAVLGTGRSPEELVAASFRFLLEREPKESILGRFDLSVIGRYFPEYPTKVAEYL